MAWGWVMCGCAYEYTGRLWTAPGPAREVASHQNRGEAAEHDTGSRPSLRARGVTPRGHQSADTFLPAESAQIFPECRATGPLPQPLQSVPPYLEERIIIGHGERSEAEAAQFTLRYFMAVRPWLIREAPYAAPGFDAVVQPSDPLPDLGVESLPPDSRLNIHHVKVRSDFRNAR